MGDRAGPDPLTRHRRRGPPAHLGRAALGGPKPAHRLQRRASTSASRSAARRDTDERIISRAALRGTLLPVVPERHRALIATAAGAGLRWGEVAGLMDDALDLDAGTLRVIRTVVEVAGHRSFKPFPKSAAGRRDGSAPAVGASAHRASTSSAGPLPRASPDLRQRDRRRRSAGPLFRARVWRPSLVRAGLLGDVRPDR